MPYEAIIFDFDGTLVDSIETLRCIFNEMATVNKIRNIRKEDLNELKNNELNEFLKTYKISKLRLILYLIRGKKKIREKLKDIPLIEGFETVIPELKKRTTFLGILSSNSKENIDTYLKNKNLRQHFDFISNTNKLLNKAKYLKTISKNLSLDKSKMLYIGDEIRDLQAAKKFGIDFVAVPWGFNSKEILSKHQPKYSIEHPSDLLKIQ